MTKLLCFLFGAACLIDGMLLTGLFLWYITFCVEFKE